MLEGQAVAAAARQLVKSGAHVADLDTDSLRADLSGLGVPL
jgi:hypothetical protein